MNHPIREFLNSMEDTCEPIVVNPNGGEALEGTAYFAWSKKGLGFGQLYFYFKEVDGQKVLHCDNECMSKETVKAILCSMVDNAVFDE